jgi:hypothetical protein
MVKPELTTRSPSAALRVARGAENAEASMFFSFAVDLPTSENLQSHRDVSCNEHVTVHK